MKYVTHKLATTGLAEDTRLRNEYNSNFPSFPCKIKICSLQSNSFCYCCMLLPLKGIYSMIIYLYSTVAIHVTAVSKTAIFRADQINSHQRIQLFPQHKSPLTSARLKIAAAWCINMRLEHTRFLHDQHPAHYIPENHRGRIYKG